ncbi:MAG: CbiX/SirB N-terminal domain-containing protein [Hyphomicrobium sp.]|nr:CbiX/SirB N-terminal domain-containing protein [Hyphomicrobium sp.]
MPLPLKDVAVVLAAHGDRGGDAPNRALRSHRDGLAAMGLFRTVEAGVLNGEPSLESALKLAQSKGAIRIAVYPMFMSAGYFTNTVLPERISRMGLDRQCRILEPLGLDLRIPELLLAEALAAAHAHGLDPGAARLLIVGHGSKLGPASANATRHVALAVARDSRFKIVDTAFLEEAPFLDDALSGDPMPTVVSGFFSGDGMHAQEDVPKAIAASGHAAVYAGSIGRSAELATVVRDAVVAAMVRT